MNIKTQLYVLRKRINDKDLLKIKSIVENEIERRLQNDKQSNIKNG